MSPQFRVFIDNQLQTSKKKQSHINRFRPNQKPPSKHRQEKHKMTNHLENKWVFSTYKSKPPKTTLKTNKIQPIRQKSDYDLIKIELTNRTSASMKITRLLLHPHRVGLRGFRQARTHPVPLHLIAAFRLL